MELDLLRAARVAAKTTPYLLYRARLPAAALAGAVVATTAILIVGLLYWAFAFFVLIAIAGMLWINFFMLCCVRVSEGRALTEWGKLALFAEMIREGDLPMGIAQPDWAKQRVADRFEKPAEAWEVYRRIHDVLASIYPTLLESAYSRRAAGSIRVIRSLVDADVVSWMTDAVAAHVLGRQSEDAFTAARNGVVLCCQRAESLTRKAVLLSMLGEGLALAVAVACLIALGIAALPADSEQVRFAFLLISVVCSMVAKVSLFDPLACASVLLCFLNETESLVPDAEWESRLEETSAAFRELKRLGAQNG